MAGRLQDVFIFFGIYEDMRYMSNLNILVIILFWQRKFWYSAFIYIVYVTFTWFLSFLFQFLHHPCRKSLASDSIHQVFFPKVSWDTGLTIAMISRLQWWNKNQIQVGDSGTDKPYSDQLTNLTSLHDKLVFQSFGGQQVWSRQRTGRSSGIYLYVFDHCCIQKYIYVIEYEV